MSTAIIEKPIHVTDDTFDETISATGKLVLVDFWADWCGPCHAIAPVLEELAADYGERLTVAKVNVDDNNRKAAEFGVRAIPTLILFSDGNPAQALAVGQPRAPLTATSRALLRHFPTACAARTRLFRSARKAVAPCTQSPTGDSSGGFGVASTWSVTRGSAWPSWRSSMRSRTI